MVLAPNNEASDQARAEKEYQKFYEEYIKEQRAQNEPLAGFSAKRFDGASVKELKVKYHVKGNGAAVKTSDTISANYFGWDASGSIFDSTNKKDTDKPSPTEFKVSEVIKGWQEGLVGVRVGSTVEITIPADMAYGTVDKGTGQPTGPLKFIVEIKKIVKDKE
jgi:FKBP-type peptidyl-prolyl cis-trans isomerase